LLQKITNRRGHRKGDLYGINAVLLAGHNQLTVA
jgi:hypothetical protein